MYFELKLTQLSQRNDPYLRIKHANSQTNFVIITATTDETPIRLDIYINGLEHKIPCHLDVDTFVPVVITHVYDPIHSSYVLEVRFNKVSLGIWHNENPDMFDSTVLKAETLPSIIKNFYVTNIS